MGSPVAARTKYCGVDSSPFPTSGRRIRSREWGGIEHPSLWKMVLTGSSTFAGGNEYTPIEVTIMRWHPE